MFALRVEDHHRVTRRLVACGLLLVLGCEGTEFGMTQEPGDRSGIQTEPISIAEADGGVPERDVADPDVAELSERIKAYVGRFPQDDLSRKTQSQSAVNENETSPETMTAPTAQDASADHASVALLPITERASFESREPRRVATTDGAKPHEASTDTSNAAGLWVDGQSATEPTRADEQPTEEVSSASPAPVEDPAPHEATIAPVVPSPPKEKADDAVVATPDTPVEKTSTHAGANEATAPAGVMKPAEVPILDVRPRVESEADSAPTAAKTPNQPIDALPEPNADGLANMIGELEESVRKDPNLLDDQLKLRLLYLATGQDDKVSDGLDRVESVRGEMLTTLLRVLESIKPVLTQSAGATPSEGLAAVEDLQRLLKQQSPVRIPKVEFITRVGSFGDYDAVEPRRFSSAKSVHVYLYTEVANFRSEPTTDGRLRTMLSQTVEIFDSGGKIIWQRSEPLIEDRTITPRQDFFIPFEIRLPESTPSGEYTLKVTIEDKLSATTDQRRLTFTIE